MPHKIIRKDGSFLIELVIKNKELGLIRQELRNPKWNFWQAGK
jgi:hypothetical protein